MKIIQPRNCMMCGKGHDPVEVPDDEYKAFTEGALNIQDAMPSVSVADRETLITGFHDACFNAMMED